MCVYLDDILVTGATEQEHLANLAQVLQRLQDAGMRVKQQKCAFLVPSVAYLGHVISAEGLRTSEAKPSWTHHIRKTSLNSVRIWVWLIIMVNSCPISQPALTALQVTAPDFRVALGSSAEESVLAYQEVAEVQQGTDALQRPATFDPRM